jgi:ribosomal protein S4
MPGYRVANGELLLDVVVAAGAAPSKREARRLFEQRAVTMDGNVVEPSTPARAGAVVQVGKRKWIRLVAPSPAEAKDNAAQTAAAKRRQADLMRLEAEKLRAEAEVLNRALRNRRHE